MERDPNKFSARGNGEALHFSCASGEARVENESSNGSVSRYLLRRVSRRWSRAANLRIQIRDLSFLFKNILLKPLNIGSRPQGLG
jgi:hypothetical protein